MKTIVVIISVYMLISCTGIKIGDRKTTIIVEKDQPFCDVTKVDPNCKVEENNINL